MKKIIMVALLAALLLIPSVCLCESPEIVLAENEYLGISENGAGGPISLKVTLEDGVIKAIDVISQHETRGLGTTAIRRVVDAMIKGNTIEIDNITGATITTNAMKEAVTQALISAGVLEAPAAEEVPAEAAAN